MNKICFKKLLEDGPITNIQMQDKQFILEIVESGEKGAPTAIEMGDIHPSLETYEMLFGNNDSEN